MDPDLQASVLSYVDDEIKEQANCSWHLLVRANIIVDHVDVIDLHFFHGLSCFWRC